MRLPSLPRPTSGGVLAVLAGVIVVILVSVLLAGIGTRATTAQVLREVRAQQLLSAEARAEHSDDAQADHDCIVALMLVIVDPKRPRDRTVVAPPICNFAPAAEHAEVADSVSPR